MCVCAYMIFFFQGFCEEFRVKWKDFDYLLKLGNEFYEKVVKIKENLVEIFDKSTEKNQKEKSFQKIIQKVLGQIKVANSVYQLDIWYGEDMGFGEGQLESSKMKAHIDQFLISECKLILIEIDGQLNSKIVNPF